MSHRCRVLSLIAAVALAAALPPALAQDGQTAEVNGAELYYEIRGAGEPLLLLHSGTQTVRMWDPFVDALAARYRVLAVDLRGHGGSTNPGGVLSTKLFAEDILALLDQLGIEKTRGIGASAGAMTLLHMATQEPERIEAMIVVGIGTHLPSACRETLAPVSADQLSENAWVALREKHKHGDEQIRALYDWVASLAESHGDMTFTPPLLAGISAKTLVVHGDRDYCFPASMAWEVYDAIPEAYLWVVPNGGHVPLQGANAPRFAETAQAFLAGEWARR